MGHICLKKNRTTLFLLEGNLEKQMNLINQTKNMTHDRPDIIDKKKDVK